MLSRAQRIALVVLPLLLVAVLIVVFYFGKSSSYVLVTRVVDGDTFEIEGGDKIRLIGVDTPETKHPQKRKECFGETASLKLKELVS